MEALARRGNDPKGEVWHRWCGLDRLGGEPQAWNASATTGDAGRGRHGMEWPGLHWIGWHRWHGSARLDTVWRSSASLARQIVVTLGKARPGPDSLVWLGMQTLPLALHGRYGKAWQGPAPLAWRRVASSDQERYGRHGATRRGCPWIRFALLAWLANARPEQARQARHRGQVTA